LRSVCWMITSWPGVDDLAKLTTIVRRDRQSRLNRWIRGRGHHVAGRSRITPPKTEQRVEVADAGAQVGRERDVVGFERFAKNSDPPAKATGCERQASMYGDDLADTVERADRSGVAFGFEEPAFHRIEFTPLQGKFRERDPWIDRGREGGEATEARQRRIGKLFGAEQCARA